MSTSSEPIVVFYKSEKCSHCITVSTIWNTPLNKTQDSIVTSLKKAYPGIRTVIVPAIDNTGQFDESQFPKDVRKYNKWFPMFLLVPGPSWNNAMSKLGPNNDVILEGVQVMNSVWLNEQRTDFEFKSAYNSRMPGEFTRWLKDALEDPKFKAIQASGSMNVPIKQQGFQPLLTPITKPANTHVPAGKEPNKPVGNICSMRIISRPK